eukprot:1137310-Pelagomonas_calceolata.AAC.3
MLFTQPFSTEATATFMFLPVWGQDMKRSPYSKLITAYPHLRESVVNLEPSLVSNFATTIYNPAPTRQYLSLNIPGTYQLMQSGIQLQGSI